MPIRETTLQSDMTDIAPIDASVVIVNWNTRQLVLDCVQHVLDHTIAHTVEIIVVDNGSNDGSVEALTVSFPGITVIRNETNHGFAKANNIGLLAAKGKYLCLINSDVAILPDCIDSMCLYMAEHNDIGLIGPQVLNKDLSIQVSCGELPSLRNTLVQALFLDRLFPHSNLCRPRWLSRFSHNTIRSVPVLSGCFLMTRRTAVLQVGVLDESFFIYKEDVDWCKRFGDAGWRVVFYPHARAIHYGGASSAATPVRFFLEMEKATRQYWKKHHGWLSQKAAAVLSFVHHGVRFCGWSLTYILNTEERLTARTMMVRYASCLRWLGGISREA
jgi:GT2 family glycosyltransferase